MTSDSRISNLDASNPNRKTVMATYFTAPEARRSKRQPVPNAQLYFLVAMVFLAAYTVIAHRAEIAMGGFFSFAVLAMIVDLIAMIRDKTEQNDGK